MNESEIIKLYKNGDSLNSIARKYNTYPTSIMRILIKNKIPLRHDTSDKNSPIDKNIEKVLEWAKAQNRFVSKAELAEIVGTKRLSPSYFEKCPELSKYIQSRENIELTYYAQKLYSWLQDNNIPYKPNDRTRLKMAVSALLLGEYENIAIQINIKPKYTSRRKFEQDMEERLYRADKNNIYLLFLHESDFADLSKIKHMLDTIMSTKGK